MGPVVPPRSVPRGRGAFTSVLQFFGNCLLCQVQARRARVSLASHETEMVMLMPPAGVGCYVCYVPPCALD